MTATGREDDRLVAEARRILKSEMQRRDFSFKQLADALQADGAGESETVQTLINKVNRGRFSFAFFLRVARAMGIQSVLVAPVPGVGAGSGPDSR